MEQLKDSELKKIVKELRIPGWSSLRKAEKIQALRERGINTNEDLENYRQRLIDNRPQTPEGPNPRPRIPRPRPQTTEEPPPIKNMNNQKNMEQLKDLNFHQLKNIA